MTEQAIPKLPPPDTRHRLIYAEQVRLLYAKAPMAIAANLINAPIVVLVLWNEVRHASLIAWLTYMIMLSMGRVWLTYEYRRAGPSVENSRWCAAYLAGIALSGIGWGSIGVFLFPEASVPHQALVAFVLAGMTAGAVAACSAMIVGFLLFAVPALVPLIIQLLSQGDDLHLAMGGMGAVYLIVLVFIARTLHVTIVSALDLRFENRDLVAYLSAAKTQVEKVNEDLGYEITERKRAQKERERLIAELQEALASLKVLQGILPICSHCKKIRDDEGSWHMVEVYVKEHSNADFSHSICPECLNAIYNK